MRSGMEHVVSECRDRDENGQIKNLALPDCAQAVSAVKAIAQQQGQKIYAITPQNASTALPYRCFPGETHVITSYGYIEIQYLDGGSLVLSRNEETGEQAYRRVTGKFAHWTERPGFPMCVVAYTTCAGEKSSICTTPEHPFWVNGVGWVSAGELKPGHVLEICDPIGYDDSIRPEGVKFADVALSSEKSRATVISAKNDGGLISIDYMTEKDVWLRRKGIFEHRQEKFSIGSYPEMPLLIEGIGWLPARDLKPGHILINYNPDDPARDGKRWQATVESIEAIDDSYHTTVYNIEVDDFHTYFVNENGIFVHDAKGPS
jgi:hypothetical protein